MAQAIFDFEIPSHLRREFVFQTAGILPPYGILFGFHTVQKIGEQAKRLSGKKVLLVTDEMLVQLGYAELVKSALEKEGIKVEVFGKVDPEPHMETADALREMVSGSPQILLEHLISKLEALSLLDEASKCSHVVVTHEALQGELGLLNQLVRFHFVVRRSRHSLKENQRHGEKNGDCEKRRSKQAFFLTVHLAPPFLRWHPTALFAALSRAGGMHSE